jgi:hypothetical protein
MKRNRLIIINLIDMKKFKFAPQLVLLLAIVAAIHAIQLPQCQTSAFYKTLPLVANETFIMDLDSFFGGYNLQYTTVADQSIQKYISLGSKFKKQKE